MKKHKMNKRPEQKDMPVKASPKIFETLREHIKHPTWSTSLQKNIIYISQKEYDEFLDKLDPERGPEIYNKYNITDNSFDAFHASFVVKGER